MYLFLHGTTFIESLILVISSYALRKDANESGESFRGNNF